MNFVSGFRLEFMYFSTLLISIRSSLTNLHGFWAACAAVIVHRNHFFCVYQQNESFESKVKFRQANNCCKRVLEAAKLASANRTTESITSQKLCSCGFWWIANSVFDKGKSAIPPQFSCLEVLSSASDKTKLFAKNFSQKSSFDDLGIS